MWSMHKAVSLPTWLCLRAWLWLLLVGRCSLSSIHRESSPVATMFPSQDSSSTRANLLAGCINAEAKTYVWDAAHQAPVRLGLGLAPASRLRGGSLRRGTIIDFLSGQPVDTEELDDIDSDEDMTGAVPVDWLPRGHFMLDEEKELLGVEEEEEVVEVPPPLPPLPWHEKLLDDARQQLEGLQTAAQNEWDRLVHGSGPKRKRGSKKTGGGKEGGVWGLLMYLGRGKGGEDAKGEDDTGQQREEGSSEEEASSEREGSGGWGRGDELRGSVDQNGVLEVAGRVMELADDIDPEGDPEIESLHHQVNRMCQVLQAAGKEEPTRRSIGVLSELHKAVREAETVLQRLLIPFGPAFSCLPLGKLLQSRNLLLRVTECAARISTLLEEGGEDLFVDLSGLGFSQMIANTQARGMWQHGPGALVSSAPSRDLRRALSSCVSKLHPKSSPGHQNARGEALQPTSPVFDDAISALTEAGFWNGKDEEVNVLDCDVMFPPRVHLFLAVEALAFGAKTSREVRESAEWKAQPPSKHRDSTLWACLTEDERRALGEVGNKLMRVQYREMMELQHRSDLVLDAMLMEQGGVERFGNLWEFKPEVQKELADLKTEYGRLSRIAHARRLVVAHGKRASPGAHAFNSTVDQSEVDEVLLEKAREGDNAACLHCVLLCGARLSATDDKGNTPLHRAAAQGHQNCVRLLAFFGGEVSAHNGEDLSPGGLASRRGHQRVSNHLSELASKRIQTGAGTDEEQLLLSASLKRLRNYAPPPPPKPAGMTPSRSSPVPLYKHLDNHAARKQQQQQQQQQRPQAESLPRHREHATQAESEAHGQHGQQHGQAGEIHKVSIREAGHVERGERGDGHVGREHEEAGQHTAAAKAGGSLRNAGRWDAEQATGKEGREALERAGARREGPKAQGAGGELGERVPLPQGVQPPSFASVTAAISQGSESKGGASGRASSVEESFEMAEEGFGSVAVDARPAHHARPAANTAAALVAPIRPTERLRTEAVRQTGGVRPSKSSRWQFKVSALAEGASAAGGSGPPASGAATQSGAAAHGGEGGAGSAARDAHVQ